MLTSEHSARVRGRNLVMAPHTYPRELAVSFLVCILSMTSVEMLV